MKVTETAVRRPIGTGIICAMILVIGVVAVRLLPVDLLPEVDFPRISVVTTYDGVGPEEIETLITRPIEQQLSTIDGVDEIEAVSAEGLSRVQLQFEWGTNLETAVNDVRSYLDRLANRLPEDAEKPVVYKFDLSSVPVASIGLSGGGDPRRLRYLAEETLSRRFERVPGVASIQVRGGRVREIRVELDVSRLVALGVSTTDVIEALRRDNRNVSAGDMRQTGKEVLVRAVGQWDGPDEIGGVLVADRRGRPVYVRDVATVLDTFVDSDSEQWVNGEPGITLRVSKQSGANTIEVVEGVRAEIDAVNRDYDGLLRMSLIDDSAEYIKSSVTNVQSGAMMGAGLAILVLLFFLRDVRATVLIAVAIPLSVIATFALMYFSGYTLNVISFGGLALGIGMLVDNAIVILENIYRKREEGLGRIQAAIEGAREVGAAVIAGTLTTIVAFAPVVFLGDFAGIFFGEMAAVVSFSLLCSLVVALTLVPTLAARVVQRRRTGPATLAARISGVLERNFNRMEAAYERLIGGALRAPWFVVVLTVLLLLGSCQLSGLIGLEMMPETDEGKFDVDVELPVGTPVERTAVVVKELERRVREVVRPDELHAVITSAGPENWWRPGGGHEGEVEVTLVPVDERARNIDEILAEVRAAVQGIPDASFRFRTHSSNMLMRLMRGGGDSRLTVEIRGHDLEDSAALAARVKEVMENIPGLVDVRIDREEGLEERTIHVDAKRAADLGLTRAQVAEALESYVLGTVATRLREGGDEFDVRVQLREDDRYAVDQLESLPIITPSGEAVPLSAVATIGGRRGVTSIERKDQERVVEVFGGLEGRTLSEVVGELSAALDRIEKPEGFTLALGGEIEEQQETFSGLQIGIILAILLVFAVMAVQFESLRYPLVVMGAIPFGAIGVILTLLITGTTFNMNSFLGAIVLVGIAVNNAIVLVDYTNLLRREQGMKLREALILAGRRRLRPILMTTMTTCLGMIPLAIGVGEGSEIQAPLARVVLGGLLSTMFVTLVVVPCLYYLIDRRRAAREEAEGSATPA